MGQRLQSRPRESDRTATSNKRFRRAICETTLSAVPAERGRPGVPCGRTAIAKVAVSVNDGEIVLHFDEKAHVVWLQARE